MLLNPGIVLSLLEFNGIGRARRGVSGTLHSQSALARLNSFPRVLCFGPLLSHKTLIVGSHANERREPGQAGNGAAISESFRCAVEFPDGSPLRRHTQGD